MAAAAYFETVQKIYIAFYQRPADPAGLKYWADQINAAGGNANAVIAAFGEQPESIALYGAASAATIGDVIDKIYMAAFNRAADVDGKAYWVKEFNDGKITASSIALAVVQGATGGDDAITIANKLQVANNFTQQVDGRALTDAYFGTGSSFNATYKGDVDAQNARDILKTVTANPATVLSPAQVTTAIQTKIADATDPIQGQTGGQTFTLTTGIDSLTGTAGNDTFNAPVSDGAAATATLGGLDTIDGGAGTDTLNIDFGTAVAALPGTVTIKNIEVIKAGTSATSGASTFDVTSVAGVQTINFSNAGDKASTVKAGSATTVTSTGGVAATVEGKAITNVTVTKASGLATVDNLNATTGVTSTGTTLTSVTLDGITDDAAINGDGITAVTLKNLQTTGKGVVAITNTVSTTLAVNVDNVGYDTAGVKLAAVPKVTTGTKAEAVTVNATGVKSALTLASGGAVKTLTITGTAALELAGLSTIVLKSIDGSAATGGLTLGALNAGTADVKTGAGKDSFEVKATKVTVDAGAGNDTVTLGSTLAIGSTVTLGAGDDVLLSNSGVVSAKTALGTVVIDGGDGIDTVAASLINATNATQFVNFERIDASAGSNNLDVELMTGSTINGVTLNGGSGTVTLQNVAVGTGLTVAGANSGSLTIGVKGAAANVADTFGITFAGQAEAGATAGSPTAVSATAVALEGVETVTIASSGTGFVANTLTVAANTKLKAITITGDKALDLSFAAANGTTGATTGVSSIDGSAATGVLKVDLANIKGVTAGVTVKGGSAADTFITAVGESATLTGGAGKDVFNVSASVATTALAATTVKTTITDFAAGDTIDLSTATDVVTTLAKVTLTAGVQNLDQALDLVGATTKTVSWFNYGADTYVVYNADATTGLDVADVLVKLTGTIDLSNATVDANGVLALA